MLSVTRVFVVIILLLVCLCGLSTCSGGHEAPPAAGASPGDDAPPPEFTGLLAPPSEYAPMLAPPRHAAYAEEDLIRHGAGYVAGLPYPNASVDGDCLVFDPNWSTATGMGSDNLSYAFYSFAVPGFDRTPQIRCGWREPPEDFSTVWIGQADWTRDSWHWYQAEEDDEIAVPSIGDNELLIMVHASAKSSALGSIGVGPKQLAAEFHVTPERALAPAQLMALMTGSVATMGSIDKYEVDWDGDWNFEADYGTESVGYQQVAEAGDYTAVGRITSSYYETATAMCNYTVLETWQHTWGLADEDRLLAVCTDGSDFCYAVGHVTIAEKGRQLLMVKYNLDGVYQWARAWGGESDDGADDVQYYDGKLYVAGYTESYGDGGKDVLLQCWDTAGNVLWTEVWGRTDDESGTGLAVTASHIYACLDNRDSSDPEFAVLLKYDHSGNHIWARALDTFHTEAWANDMVMTYDGISGEYRFHLTGSYDWGGEDGYVLLYIRADESGNLDEPIRHWKPSGPEWQGNAITAFGNPPEIYIAGQSIQVTDPYFDRGLLVQLGWGSTSVAVVIRPLAKKAQAYDLFYRDGHLLVCGNSLDDGLERDGLEGDGFLADFSPLGELNGVSRWDVGTHDRCCGMTSIPDAGVIIAGSAPSQDTGSWLEESWDDMECFTMSSNWFDNTWVTLVSVSGAMESPTTQAEVITYGIEDTGAGNADAAIMSYGMP